MHYWLVIIPMTIMVKEVIIMPACPCVIDRPGARCSSISYLRIIVRTEG